MFHTRLQLFLVEARKAPSNQAGLVNKAQSNLSDYPRSGCCATTHGIVAHGKSLFTSGTDGGEFFVEERDLESNRITRTWEMPKQESWTPQLLVTQDRVVLWGREVLVYSRAASHKQPVLRFNSEDTFRAAAAGRYVAAVGNDALGKPTFI